MTPPGNSGPGLADLQLFWDLAARQVPVIVVGGGRWGSVWLQVLASARGGTGNLTWVARSDPDGARGRAGTDPSLAGIRIADSIDAAVAIQAPEVAIVASRPRDHVADAIDALAAGAHVLLEKPIAPSTDAARLLLEEAGRTNRTLGIGCEFALLPAFALCRDALGPPGAGETFVLEWCDPAGEVRHGAAKARHDEITMLTDLLSHAWSIFRTLRPDARLSLARAELHAGGDTGEIEFCDQNGSRYRLQCDRSATGRRRHLHAVSNGGAVTVDFAQHPSTVTLNGKVVGQSPKVVALSSVLRIEIGAFLADIGGLSACRPLSTGLDDLVALHAELENACR